MLPSRPRVVAVLASLSGAAAACTGAVSSEVPLGPPPARADVCPDGLVSRDPYPVLDQSPYAADYRLRVFGQVDFQGTTYQVVNAMPWSYLASHVQAGKTFAVSETPTHYVVDSHFELPYLPCLMDEVAWTPGAKNKGWAIGSGDDPAALVAANGAGRPFVYHVVADDEYGYATYTEPLPDDPIRYSGYRPTWVVHEEGADHHLYYLDPDHPDRYGFAWPRHGDHWELNFGLFVDPAGKVYVPKQAALALPQWDTYLECVVVNLADAPIPTTRTQFPGNESYYASDTFLPGLAAPPSVGHRYWGQKGRSMDEVAVWEDDGAPGLPSPGNYHKPYSGGCDVHGYNFAHAEGFTWPELRAYRTAHGDVVSRDQLYSVTVYKVARDGTATLLGTLSYAQQANGEWLPTASGPEAHSLNDRNGRWIINGPIFPDRGERAVAVVQNL
jgi:hypothetical protein